MSKKKKKNGSGGFVHKPKTFSEYQQLDRDLRSRGYIAYDALKPGIVRSLTIGDKDPSGGVAKDMSANMTRGAWCTGPINGVAWLFDDRSNTANVVPGPDGKPLGPGYVKWGAGDNIPSVVPPLAQALPYTASPLKYIADLTAGLGPKLMYAFDDDTLCEYKKAGYRILERIEKLKNGQQEDPYGGDMMKDPDTGIVIPIGEVEQEKRPDPILRGLGIDYWKDAYREWERTWKGFEEQYDLDNDTTTIEEHVPGAKEFLEENNLNFHLTQCEQDDVMLDIYFPTVGFHHKGYRRLWKPVINRIGFLPAHSTRLAVMNSTRHIDYCYFSDSWRTKGVGGTTVAGANSAKYTMYPAAMPQHLLHELRYLVKSNQKKGANSRPMWVVCPTFYPSLNKPYYPQPAWWSVFSSKAFDFASTILYDKYKQRENNTTWGRIIYISLDYLNMMFGDMGIEGDKDAQEKFIDELDANVEDFLQHRDNTGKTMRQFMWDGPDGKQHYNVEVVDIKETTSDGVKAGKEELELSTSPIFLALGVDPRLVGVPMVAASNGGTAVREIHLLKQQQLNVKQRLYMNFLNSVVRFNQWDEHAEFHIIQQTLTTLDNSKTGTVETIAGEKA